MPRRAKIVLVSAVLAAGLLVAWQFRKSPAERATTNSAAESSARAEMAQPPTLQSRNTAPPLDLSTAPAQQTGPSTDPANRFAATSSDASPPPRTEPSPPLPPSPEKSADATPDHTAAAASKPAETAVPELPANFSGVDRPDRVAPFDLRGESLSGDATVPTHKIVDGDSLPLLAERYLGSAARATEIFACNRDVLSDPELLPIGARLRIPSGPARPASAAAPPAGVTSDATPPTIVAPSANAPPQSQIAGEMAKAPPLLDIGAPGLSPLPPLGQQTSSPGRIYIVQTGDTLSGIAQKLYGDGGRTDALLQGNRDQLRSEQDLRAGMMLEAP